MALVVSIKVVMTILLFLALTCCMKVTVRFSQLPSNWNTLLLLSWLRPPYIYVILNGIIIGIAASSLFHRDDRADHEPVVEVDSDSDPTSMASPEHFVHETKIIHNSPSYRVLDQPRYRVYDHNDIVEEVIKTMVVYGYPVTEPEFVPESEDREDNDNDEVAISNTTWKSPEIKSIEPSVIQLPGEKPLVSSRFSTHRKPVKASPEGGGRASKVSKPRQHETLENTWKMITEGRSEPLSRQMKMCDTWEKADRWMELGYDQIEDSPTLINKPETVEDRTNYQKQLVPLKMSENLISRNEPSLSRDELNRRVEAFINKFNEDMRLQRQHSLQQYVKTIQRGSHQ